jgi:hypothetical protein
VRPAWGGGCEHRFALSIKGSPRKWFDDALARGDATGAWSAAHELGQVNLADALALCLLLRDQHPPLYERAAARWAARFALEARSTRLAELGLAVAALQALRGADVDAGAAALAALSDLHRQPDIADVLERWARDQRR